MEFYSINQQLLAPKATILSISSEPSAQPWCFFPSDWMAKDKETPVEKSENLSTSWLSVSQGKVQNIPVICVPQIVENETNITSDMSMNS